MILWIDASAGASGDMFLGALHDLGVPLEVMQAPLDELDLDIALRPERVTRAGLAATKMHVDVPESRTMRHLSDIVELLKPLPEPARNRTTAVFRALAQAEATVHGVPVDDVHFHEVGALDSIADIVGVCAAMIHLVQDRGLERVVCSTVSLGSGTTRGEHGPIPVPVPAVLALLTDRAVVQSGLSSHEATTPTGAALIAVFATDHGSLPSMVIDQVGVGAGTRDTPEVANALRLVIGRVPATESSHTNELVQIDTNIDDMDSRLFPSVLDAALDAGAVDAWITPIVMKKGRPAHTLSALTPERHAGAVRQAIFRNSTTIGVRHHVVRRHILDRSMSTVSVDGQTVGVKTATLDGRVVNVSVEWDDVVAAAGALGAPASQVLARAERLAHELRTHADDELSPPKGT